MVSENTSPLCWMSNTDAQIVKQERINTLLRHILEAGLWNVPQSIIDQQNISDTKNDFIFKELHPHNAMPYLVAVHKELGSFFVIFNAPNDLTEDLPQKCKEIFEAKIIELLGDKAEEFCKEISFKYADYKLIGTYPNFFSSLLDFTNKGYIGCVHSSAPYYLEGTLNYGYSMGWGATVDGCIFVAKQPLSYLAPWKNSKEDIVQFDYKPALLSGDSIRADLPVLEENILTDVNKGHWDLYQPDGIVEDVSAYNFFPTESAFIARNPALDVQSDSIVSIDFGTSSTVVAIQNSDRSRVLQRIGIQSHSQKVEAKHFENPTMLEFLDYRAFMEQWNAVPYRPFTRWSDVCCSHKAKNELRSTTVDSKITNSGLTSLKIWAQNKKTEQQPRLRDQQGTEVQLSPITTQLDNLNQDYNVNILNPIEIYAYFIGLNLNNQAFYGGRIFKEYYLTFPIKFDRATRDAILYSFRRGLKRSLPPALAYTPRWIEENFRVEEHANEPTAYAAAALSEMPDMQPTSDGIAFGVFDFGGGTTDFSFGLYRLATPQENIQDGFEEVLDILDTAGDENLGGEHLLEGMASLVIENNKDILLEKKIPFYTPSYVQFHGQELLKDASSIAHCNTTKLCEMLRSFWEEGILHDEDSGVMSETFFTKSNTLVENIPLTICAEELKNCLIERISKGVRAFFTAFAQAFKRENVKHADKFHVLLAGNSCRSPLVKEAFDLVLEEIQSQKKSFENIYDAIDFHEPLLADEKNFDKPTMKTGVALGLLKIVPGETFGVIERLQSSEESPFRFSVGRFTSKILTPTLERNAKYGQWKELGTVRNSCVEVIGYSLLPEAIEGKVSDSNCPNIRHRWDKKHVGMKIFIQAHSPDTIALALAGEDNSIDETTLQIYSLK